MLWLQIRVCRDKTLVATKMILTPAPANDRGGVWSEMIIVVAAVDVKLSSENK